MQLKRISSGHKNKLQQCLTTNEMNTRS